MRTVVVGVDGSDSSKRALEWAAEHAWDSGATVRALYSWTPSVPAASFDAMRERHPEVDVAADAKRFLRDVVRDVLGASPDVVVVQEVHRSTPARMLIEASRDADLLVLGSRGTGGFAGLLLGSVGEQCVHHASCPVVIVPHDRRT